MDKEMQNHINIVLEILNQKREETIKKYEKEPNEYLKEKIKSMDISIQEVKKLLGFTLTSFYSISCSYCVEDDIGDYEEYFEYKIIKATSKKQALQKYNDFIKNGHDNYRHINLDDIDIFNGVPIKIDIE